jgi:hypothetical protein
MQQRFLLQILLLAQYVEIKCQLDATEVFIADIIACSICGNKMPTGCNRGFYCRSYCLLNMWK